MIIWLILFFIVIAISFILAYFSMKEFPDLPGKRGYGVFLIQNPSALNIEILNLLHYKLSGGEIISIERLFKGYQKALVIFGPKHRLQDLTSLGLLELEDYTANVSLKLVAWEIAPPTEASLKKLLAAPLFKNMPVLENQEQFWWQITLQAKKDRFHAQIRTVVISSSAERLKILASSLQNLGDGILVKMPRPLASTQIFENYQARSLMPLSNNPLTLTSLQLRYLVG